MNSIVYPIVGALACCLIALGTVALLMRFFDTPSEQGRFRQLDGLRGILAFSVFLHHAEIWSRYLKTGVWITSPSRVFVHLGKTSVAIFFMITAFLFIKKIANNKGPGFNWARLYLHRIFRLTPVYVVAVLIVAIIVGFESSWHLNDNVGEIARQLFSWLSFCVFGAPDIDDVSTGVIIANVTWSLQYEWTFYLLLPLLSIAFFRGVNVKYLVVSTALAAVFSAYLPGSGLPFLIFTGGAIAVFFEERPIVRRFASGKVATLVLLACGVALFCFQTPYSPLPLLFLTIIFILVASGNTLYDVLTRPVLIFFGELTYAIYLFHGILLFLLLNYVRSRYQDILSSPVYYWTLMIALTPIVILVSFFMNRAIERPGIKIGKKIDRLVTLRFVHLKTRVGKFSSSPY